MHQRGQSEIGPSSEVEADLLRAALEGTDSDRLLDVGCGSGRLVAPLVDSATRYVGVDLDDRLLHDARVRGARRSPIALVRADANRLPFCDTSFAVVVMVRLFHRLSNPTAVLREFRRILRPRGTLVVAVFPRPTLATLLYDVWTGLSAPRREHSITFSRRGRVEVTSGQNPGYVETLGITRARLNDQGFRIVRELGCGYEELPVLRRIPSVFWVQLGRLVRNPNWFPCVFIVAERGEEDRPSDPIRGNPSPRLPPSVGG
jgi:ubiquinone/menaquinone biosynthesis C-methylase UbiE